MGNIGETHFGRAHRPTAKALRLPAVQLRIGKGENVPRLYAEWRGQLIFLDALHRLVPQSTADLVTAEARALSEASRADMVEMIVSGLMAEQAAERNGEEHGAIPEPEQTELNSATTQSRDSASAFGNYVDVWMDRYNLCDPRYKWTWLSEAASFTIRAAHDLFDKTGQIYGGPLAIGGEDGVHADKTPNHDAYPTDPFQRYTLTPKIALIDVPVYLDMLKYAAGDAWTVIDRETGEHLGEAADDGLLGTFDPRTETAKEAEARLLDAIRPRLREALEHIVACDRVQLGAIAPPPYKSPKAFEWLVRYQVMNEDMDEIANAYGVTIQAVSKQIHKAKDMIGLTLRERSKPGPKPGTSPNRVR